MKGKLKREKKMDWQEFKKRRFKEDSKLKKEYDKLEPEYKLISQIIGLRKEKEISQKQLAKMMNTKQPSIARFEGGDVSPTIAFLKKMADVLNYDLDIKFRPRAG